MRPSAAAALLLLASSTRSSLSTEPQGAPDPLLASSSSFFAPDLEDAAGEYPFDDAALHDELPRDGHAPTMQLWATRDPEPRGVVQGMQIGAYYPDWQTSIVPVDHIQWDHVDYLSYAFGLLTPQYDIKLSAGSDTMLKSLVSAAHSQNPRKRVVLSIGGWTGSGLFSEAVATAQSRDTLAKNMVAAAVKWELDGIDIDWEYPGLPGAGNPYTPSDSANYLLFLQALRADLPKSVSLSAATQVWPFAGPNGQPLADVSGFADVFDWILMMNYDINGASSEPGPNAPLRDACGNSSQPLANALSAIDSWTSAGMPANKILLGVPAYGYLSTSKASSLRTRAGAAVQITNADGSASSGQVDFGMLVRSGALERTSKGTFAGAGGWTRKWDECSKTPFLYSGSQVVSYDDPNSLLLKAKLARNKGLGGLGGWTLIGDTDAGDLYAALMLGLGRGQ